MQGDGAIFSKFRSTGNKIQKLVAELRAKDSRDVGKTAGAP